MTSQNICSTKLKGYTTGLKVRLAETVRGSYFISPPGTVLKEDRIISAVSNQNGAISGICDNGELLGLYPGEFEFIEAPEWILRIWVRHQNCSGDSALKLIRGAP